MKATMRNSRNGNAKHNDRDFDLHHEDNDGHIDITRQHLNIYENYYHDPQISFLEAEHRFYKEHYKESLEEQNRRHLANRHKERCATIKQLYSSERTCPEETILQIGDVGQTVDLETFIACVQDYLKELDKYSEHVHVLDWAIHGDEATPHAHIRKVYDYIDDQGLVKISQNKALEAEGFFTRGKASAHNNNKIDFDNIMREKWYDICEAHEIEIERTPIPNAVHRSKTDFLVEKGENVQLALDEAQRKLQATQLELLANQAELDRIRKQREQIDKEEREKRQKKKRKQRFH